MIGEKTWGVLLGQTPVGKRIFRSPAYPRTVSNTHQRERTKVWKHRGEEGILARLLPTPLCRATLQGTKLFGVGKFFPQESLKAVSSQLSWLYGLCLEKPTSGVREKERSR